MKIHKIEQGTQEWLEVRKGKMTASNAQAIAANGKGLETYINDILAEYYSTAIEERYSNDDMERGKELEGVARELYELTTGLKVEQVGFVEIDEYAGCSPDGLIGEEGGIEIKCPNDKNYFHVLMSKEIDTKYEWQMQMNMLVTGRKWWDYVCFNPNFKKDIVIIRIEADAEKQEKLKLGLEKGKKIIKELKQKYDGKNSA